MHCRVAIWRGIYKKSFLEKNKIHFYTDLRRFDDLPFKIEVFAAAKSVIAIDEYLYYYRLSRPDRMLQQMMKDCMCILIYLIIWINPS